MLFDTGDDTNKLHYNMEKLGIDLQDIEAIVLSHAHGDHTGGIEIVRHLSDVQVFVPSSFFSPMRSKLSRFRNVEVVEVNDNIEIVKGITSTGEIGRIEQALMVQSQNGLVIVTGCSHPGLERILSMAGEFGPIYGVVGGFHGFDRLEVLEDKEMIVPCHCTRLKKRILQEYPRTSSPCAAGRVFTI